MTTAKPHWYKTYTDKRGLHWLFFLDYDHEADENVLHQQVSLGGFISDIKIVGFSDAKAETAIKNLNPEKNAENCFKALIAMGAVDESGNDLLTEADA